MNIVSFAWTTPALLAGRKTVTRRRWAHNYARRFYRQSVVQAYDKSQRVGGKRVALIYLTVTPYREAYSAMPDSDYEAEGFKFFEEQPELLPANAPWPVMNWSVFEEMRASDEVVTVVRFRRVGDEQAAGLSSVSEQKRLPDPR